MPSNNASNELVIIGIDPGLASTGIAIISTKNGKITPLSWMVVRTSPQLPTSSRLKIIYEEVRKNIQKYHANEVAVESVYFSKNTKTASVVSECKGVVLLAAEMEGLPAYIYTPLQMKLAIVGNGRASKKEVQEMLQKNLDITEKSIQDDAADALGIAFCHFLLKRIEGLIK